MSPDALGSDNLKDALGAQAFTHGNDIHLGRNFSPDAASGKNLLAHELAHSRQQGAASPASSANAAPPSTEPPRT